MVDTTHVSSVERVDTSQRTANKREMTIEERLELLKSPTENPEMSRVLRKPMSIDYQLPTQVQSEMRLPRIKDSLMSQKKGYIHHVSSMG